MPSNSSIRTILFDSVESDDVITSIRNVSNNSNNYNNNNSKDTNLYEDLCQFCPETRFLQHYFAKNCIPIKLQPECKPKFCPKYFDCPKEKELPKNGLSTF